MLGVPLLFLDVDGPIIPYGLPSGQAALEDPGPYRMGSGAPARVGG
jgi:hypothetical protein